MYEERWGVASKGESQSSTPASESEPQSLETGTHSLEDLEDPFLLWGMTELFENELWDDFSLTFSSPAAMRRFLGNLSGTGLELRASLPWLSVSRFRVTNPGLARSTLAEEEEIVALEVNSPVFRPRLPRISEDSVGERSAKSVGELLNLQSDREGWGLGVKIAIIDSGIDFSHPSLSHLEYEKISLLPGGSEPADSLAHGTAIASIIAGLGDDSMGIAPSASLLSMEVLNARGEGDAFSVAEAILTAVDKGSAIINLSLGGYAESQILRNAVEYARDNGVVVVAASGNDGVRGVSYPARFDSVIGVGALTAEDTVASFSNFGPGIDLVAPGEGVLSAWSQGEYALMDGTSSAAAFITGALASEISKNPNLSPYQVRELLFEYANEIGKPGFDELSGYGALNLNRIIHRNSIDYHDAAIVGYYFSPENLENAKTVGSVPFSITVQNQGSTWINGMNLRVRLRGVTRNFYFSNLSPGQTRSEQLYLESAEGKSGFEITSEIELVGQQDLNLKNNLRKSRLYLPAGD